MGLSTSLSNAISGLRVTQDSLDILSRNVANQGTPGYHRQSLQISDYNSQNSSYARTIGTQRAFDQSLQTYYNRQVSDTASASVAARYLDRLQGMLGQPGSASSLDTVYGQFQTALQGLSTSPDDFTARSQVVNSAQSMARRLNQLSSSIQEMRTEAEGQIAVHVQNINGMLNSLFEVNQRLLDLGMTDSSRSSLLDQRDRLVAGVAEIIDVRADYRADGTVALMTRSGVGLIDGRPSKFEFEAAGRISATSGYDSDPANSTVGRLTMVTPSGLRLDLQRLGAIQGGEFGGLINLRDRVLVEAQAQLDEIAAGLAQALSSVQTPGMAIADGFSVPTDGMAPGDDLRLSVSVGGVAQNIRIVNTATPGMDYRDASGTRVIGIDFGAGSAAASAQLAAAFAGGTPPLSVTVADTGTGISLVGSGTTEVNSLVKRTTATGTQNEGPGLLFFTDGVGSPFTNSLDTDPPQKVGFAARISVNPALLADNRLLVQTTPGETLGNSARPNYLIEQLENMQFVSGGDPARNGGRFQLNGNLGDIVAQVVGFQGATIGRALSVRNDSMLTLDTITNQMAAEYGVNVDEEMSRLVELQNAYAASARVVSVVKELLDALMASV